MSFSFIQITVGPSASLKTPLPAPICIERLINNSSGGDTFMAPICVRKKKKKGSQLCFPLSSASTVESSVGSEAPEHCAVGDLGGRGEVSLCLPQLCCNKLSKAAEKSTAFSHRPNAPPLPPPPLPRLAVRPQSGENRPRFFFFGIRSSSIRGKSLFAVTYFLAAASAFLIRQNFLGRNVSENRNLG